MITVKKDAIKIKTSDGMQNSGVICQIGTFGTDWFKYVNTLSKVFQNAAFQENTNLVFDMPNFGIVDTNSHMYYAFCGTTGLTSIKLSCNDNGFSRSHAFAFANSPDLKIIDLTDWKCGILHAQSIFQNCEKLEAVKGVLTLTNNAVLTNAFYKCYALKEVRFTPNCIFEKCEITSPLLSDKSVQSIIDALGDLTGTTSKTVQFNTDVKAKLTENQIAQITSKNWTLA